MKVICRYCRKLVEEKQAIKMSEKEYSTWVVIKTRKPKINSVDDYSYTQICLKCWRSSEC